MPKNCHQVDKYSYFYFTIVIFLALNNEFIVFKVKFLSESVYKLLAKLLFSEKLSRVRKS